MLNVFESIVYIVCYDIGWIFFIIIYIVGTKLSLHLLIQVMS